MQNNKIIELTLVSPNGMQRGSAVYFTKPEIHIGRTDDCDIRLACDEVSRRHCKIGLDEEGLWVEDNDSANGTFVEGIEVEGRHRLEPGDVVEVGTMYLEVELRDDAFPANVDVGGTLRWGAPLEQEAEEFEASGQTMRRSQAGLDAHELGLTQALGLAIDGYVKQHPDISKDKIRAVLKQMHEALDDGPDPNAHLDENVPSLLQESWPHLPEDVRSAMMAMVYNSLADELEEG